MKNKFIYLYILLFPLFILSVVIFKKIYGVGITDLGTFYYERLLLFIIPCGLLLFTFVLIKILEQRVSKLLLISAVIFACIMTSFVYVKNIDIYHKLIPVKYYSPIEKVKDLEKEILMNPKFDQIDLEYSFKALDNNYENSNEFKRRVKELIDKFIIFEDKSIKEMKTRNIVAKIAQMDSNGFELIKIKNKLFLFKKKDLKK